MSAAVILRHVTKHFGRSLGPNTFNQSPTSGRMLGRAGYLAPLASLTAVEDISFSVEDGEMFILAGASKSGKSTLVCLLAGRMRPDLGELRVMGRDPARQGMGVQRLVNRTSGEASFFPRRSALENLAFYNHGQESPAAEALIGLGLQDWELTQPLSMLPRNRQQLVFLAQAVLPLPRLLLLDEPLRYLDAAEKNQALVYLNGLRAAHGLTMMVATRHPEEVVIPADHTVWLANGRLVSVYAKTDQQPAAWS